MMTSSYEEATGEKLLEPRDGDGYMEWATWKLQFSERVDSDPIGKELEE